MTFKKGHKINIGRKRPDVSERLRKDPPMRKPDNLSAFIKRNTGPTNPIWKGDDVSYMGIHAWARMHVPKPKLCEECNEESSYDVANISGKYLRDITDWKRLCRRCHIIGDGRVDRLNSLQKTWVRRDPQTGRFLPH